MGPDMKIFPNTEEQHKAIIKLLNVNNTIRFTYTRESDKNLKVVLRGIPVTVSNEEVQDELNQIGFDTVKVVRLYKGSNKEAVMPLIFVKLTKTDKNKDIYEMTRFMSMIIKVVKFTPKKGP